MRPEVLQPVEGVLDAPAKLVETLAEAERLLFPWLFFLENVWDDKLRARGVAAFAGIFAIRCVVGIVAGNKNLYVLHRASDRKRCSVGKHVFFIRRQKSDLGLLLKVVALCIHYSDQPRLDHPFFSMLRAIDYHNYDMVIFRGDKPRS
jgi:hypothetical protein